MRCCCWQKFKLFNIALICLALSVANSLARPALADWVAVDAGVFLPRPAGVALDRNGSKSFYEPRQYYIGPRVGLPLGEAQRVEFATWFLLPWDSNLDGGSQTQVATLFRAALGHFVSKRVLLSGGTTFRWVYISSTAQSVTQRNGSTTRTFFTPSQNRSTWSASIDASVGVYLIKDLRLSFDVLVWRALSEYRSASVAAGAHYAFF
ncbi:MAG TPA: hypothetical protein PLH57_11835 [Oligoflexia bacterium]|nr:hypothetical protein [Oligoflexia bacterium]